MTNEQHAIERLIAKYGGEHSWDKNYAAKAAREIAESYITESTPIVSISAEDYRDALDDMGVDPGEEDIRDVKLMESLTDKEWDFIAYELFDDLCKLTHGRMLCGMALRLRRRCGVRWRRDPPLANG